MAIEYGAFIVDGLYVKEQTLSLSGQSTGLTNAAGFAPVNETLVHALARSRICGLGAHHQLS